MSPRQRNTARMIAATQWNGTRKAPNTIGASTLAVRTLSFTLRDYSVLGVAAGGLFAAFRLDNFGIE